MVDTKSPEFNATKAKAYDRIVMSDIKRAREAAESYFAIHMTYPTSASEAGFTP